MRLNLFFKRMSLLIVSILLFTGLPLYNVTAEGTPEFISISAGNSFAVALAKDGSVWSWGENSDGQLGDGTSTNRNTPQKIKGLSGIIKIACGEFHAIALKKDGTVWTWGSNVSGQLGNSAVQRDTKVPAVVKGLKDIVSVAGGSKQSFALSKDGTLWGWGRNYEGQLALNNVDYTSRPTVIKSLPKLTYITSKFEYSMGMTENGDIFAWGNFNGGSTHKPVKINKFIDVKEICTLRSEAIFLLKDGTVWKLQGDSGEIAQLKDLTDINQISGGTAHIIALKKDGTVWSWGKLFSTTSIVGVPGEYNNLNAEKINSINNMTFIASGSNSDYGIDNKRRVFSWGNNSYGQLGINTIIQNSVPAKVKALSNVRSISTVDSYSIALKEDGTVYEWSSYDDEVTSGNKGLPLQKTGIPKANYISCTDSNGAIIDFDGKLWIWGVNVNNGSIPVCFDLNSNTVKELSGYSLDTFLVLMNDGTIWYLKSANGNDGFIQIQYLPKIKQISSNFWGFLALAEDGTVWQGDYSSLEESNDNLSDNGRPKKIDLLSDIVSVSAGRNFFAVLKSDGSVWTWGNNTNGQLGNGTLIKSDLPVRVNNLSDISKIFAGREYCMAIKKDGTVWSWGNNTQGQLGDGTTISRSTPVQAKGLKNIANIAAGYGHSLAVNNSGDVYSWGTNDNGQLGMGIGPFVQEPTIITIK